MNFATIAEKVLMISFWVVMIQLLGVALTYFWEPFQYLGAGLLNLDPGLRGQSELGAGLELVLLGLAGLYVLLSAVHGIGRLITRNP